MSSTPSTGARAALVTALILSLAACAPGTAAPSAAPPPSASDIATPTAEPADPLEAVVSITVHPDVLALQDADGAVVAEVDFMGDGDDAVAALADVFGGDPVSEEFEGDLHFPGGIEHRWEGFKLIEMAYDETQRTEGDLDNLLWPRLVALIEAPEVGGVAVTSVAGRVGDRVDQLAAPIDPEWWTCSGWAVETLDVPRASGATNTVGVSLTFSGAMGMRETPPSGDETVTLLRAPADVAEGCV